MKRADIKPGEVYGYTEDRAHIHRYSPVIVLSTDLYMTMRFGGRLTEPAPPRSKMQRGRSYQNRIGMLAVFLYHADHDSVRKLRALVSVQACLDALNGVEGTRTDILDPDDPERTLGRYGMLTNASYLHGDYYELTRALDERQAASKRLAEERERERVAAVSARNELADRLDALGLTGYHAAKYESPGSQFSIKVEDLEELMGLAELAVKYREYGEREFGDAWWPGRDGNIG